MLLHGLLEGDWVMGHDITQPLVSLLLHMILGSEDDGGDGA